MIGSVEQYIKGECAICPACGSGDLEDTDTFHKGAELTLGVLCLDCGAEWFEIYQLERIETK